MPTMESEPSHLLHQTLSSISDKFQVREISLPDQPIFLAVAVPLSDSVTGFKPRLPAGRGFTKSQAAMSTAAEAVELMCCLSTKNMDRSKMSGSGKDGDFLLGTDMETGVVSKVAAQSVFLDYAAVFDQHLTHDADTTGCASGVTLLEAKMRGLLECIERDALAIWWYGRQSRSHISLDFLDVLHPRLSFWLGERNRRTIAIDITTDVGVPVVVVASSERDGSFVAMGSAANLNLQSAAIAATTEMIQIEASMELSGQNPNLDLEEWFAKASTSEMPQFQHNENRQTILPISGGSVLAGVRNAGFSATAIDLSLPVYPIASARVLVPGFCGMKRRINAARVLAHGALFPSTKAALTTEEFESFDPY
jgi:YcaO cyclodehydratase, ATP-ad Mg2+-binding